MGMSLSYPWVCRLSGRHVWRPKFKPHWAGVAMGQKCIVCGERRMVS